MQHTQHQLLEHADDHWVYPVISRRAGGLSLGINLNPNNACNWRCIYCQVPKLARGGPPPVDLSALRAELADLLDEILQGDFLARQTPPCTALADVAFAGNGEPTSSREFPQALAVVIDVLKTRGLLGQLPIRLITNGSLLDRPSVQEALATLGRNGGEIWFKFDAATDEARLRINGTQQTTRRALANLRAAAALCPLWLQSCFFAYDGQSPPETEIEAWLQAVASCADVLQGIHLYGLARPSQQPEAEHLSRLPAEWLEALAERTRKKTGLTVKVSP